MYAPILPSIALLWVLGTYAADAAEIAVTFDDLPYANPHLLAPDDGLEIVARVNEALAGHGVTATGFVIGHQVDDDTFAALSAFADAGHTLGNHSWSHRNYNRITPAQFRDEIRKTHRILTDFPTSAMYFRFPYLSEGETKESSAAAKTILAEELYQNVPPTLHISDWLFDKEYKEALAADDTRWARRVVARYLRHARNEARRVDRMSQNNLGRSAKHILLLHMNRLNADHLDRLLSQLSAEGWDFITIPEALADPIYSSAERRFAKDGMIHIERVTGPDSYR